MSATATVPLAPPAPDALRLYRDDGPVARALGRALRASSVPAVALQAVGLVPLVAAVAAAGAGASPAVAAAVGAWLVLWGAAASSGSVGGALDWAAPQLVRFGEYCALIWIAALDGGSAVPAAFALLCALAFRHYERIYRLRHRGATPPAWLDTLALGWDGRVLAASALLVAGVLPGALLAGAALLGVAAVGDAIVAWTRRPQSPATAQYEDEEDGAL